MSALRLLFTNTGPIAIWPPAGLALGVFLVFGYGAWPFVLLGAFFVHVMATGAPIASVGVALGTTLEGLIGAVLLNRYANGRQAFERARDVFRFAVLGALASTLIGATSGSTTLSLVGSIAPNAFDTTWLTWWLGGAAAVLVLTPVVVSWSAPLRARHRRGQWWEAAALGACLVLASELVFGGLFPDRNYPLDFLCLPVLLWAALRFDTRAVSGTLLMMSALAIWGTLQGYGPFARSTREESLLLLQAFLGAASLMTLTLSAVVSSRRRVTDQLRLMSVTDGLTGLANYRHLIAVLEGEIRRSGRTGRPFAVLFLDVDRLKRINDRHGHLVGSRVLCRVADVLRGSCRAIDTAARYGGDEFTLVLPETDDVAARQVAARIADRLAADVEVPVVSVSAGLALYPKDGTEVEALLSAADRDLYEAKSLLWQAPRWA
jgi:diguanylate cyclase (GGDEF)-like protein